MVTKEMLKNALTQLGVAKHEKAIGLTVLILAMFLVLVFLDIIG